MAIKKSHIDIAIHKLNTQTERELIQAYKQSLDSIRGQLGQVYAKYQTTGSLTYSEMSKYGRLNALFDEINIQVKALTGRAASKIKGLEEKVYKRSYYGTAYNIESKAQAKLRYSILNPKVIQAAIQNPVSGLTLNQILSRNRRDIITKLRQEITQGLIKGEAYNKVAFRIKDVLEGDVAKARRLVRTESHRNQSQAFLDSLKHAESFGVKTVKVWESTRDSKTRDSHASMDGQKVAIDENFKFVSGDNAGQEVSAPGLSGIVEEDINCRCVVREEIVGYEPGIKDSAKGQIPDNYDDWAEHKNI
jgi:SPP1 gp7 family putative phage head morphogenesis protein